MALLISLFTAGVKLALPLKDKRWRIPVQLATLSMLLPEPTALKVLAFVNLFACLFVIELVGISES